jgi:hypothetical protein
MRHLARVSNVSSMTHLEARGGEGGRGGGFNCTTSLMTAPTVILETGTPENLQTASMKSRSLLRSGEIYHRSPAETVIALICTANPVTVSAVRERMALVKANCRSERS